MLIPDVNLLVYAYNEDAPFHAAAKVWWETLLSEDEPVGLAWVAMLGFIRIMSNRRVLASPMPLVEAVGHCKAWLAMRNVHIVLPGPSHLDVMASLLDGPMGSNLVTDARPLVTAPATSSVGPVVGISNSPRASRGWLRIPTAMPRFARNGRPPCSNRRPSSASSAP